MLAQAITIAEQGMTFDIVRQSGLLPTLEILNSFFQCGIDDAASERAIEWKPFSLTATEYEQFEEHCRQSIDNLTIDGLGFNDYPEWFSAVAIENTGG